MSDRSPTDGRVARGRARRLQIVKAALAILAERGADAVTHRAIAARAGIPLASTTYHYASIDDIVGATLDHANELLVEGLATSAWPSGVEGLAAFVARSATEHRSLLVAEYELYMIALRDPVRVDAAMRWLDVVTDHFLAPLGSADRRAVQAMLEGVCLHATLRPSAYTTGEIERLLRVATEGSAGRGGSGSAP